MIYPTKSGVKIVPAANSIARGLVGGGALVRTAMRGPRSATPCRTKSKSQAVAR